MNTCKWCQESSKTKVLDAHGVCQACRKASRYDDRRYEDWITFDPVNGGSTSSKRTRPVGEVKEDKE